MHTETCEYSDGSTALEAFVAYDSSLHGKLPCVLIFHAWRGRDDFVAEKAREIAALGYVGFCVDVYGKGVQGNGVDECSKLMAPFMEDRAMLERRINAGLEAAKGLEMVNGDSIGAIGYCFGGLCALDLARSGADVRAVVSFHGLLHAPLDSGHKIHAKVLVQHGNEDPMVSAEEVAAFGKEMTEAEVDWQLHIYGNAMHAFTNPAANDPDFGTVYNESADKRSWLAMKNFLAESL
ncbi:MAG: dienelactone hydrolase family protein [Simkaniaceae bacterium]|nr:dienelactone hydrolase family protein [Simkaniaceae bacterium]